MKIFSRNFSKSSIKKKLIVSFLSIIIFMLLIFLSFIFFQVKIINSYKEVIDNMILEREISEKIPVFLEYYNDLCKNIGNPERLNKYKLMHNELENIFLKLDNQVTNEESRVVYSGLKNIVKGIMADCDNGIKDINKGDITTYAFYYAEANRKSYYVDENTALLLTKEVEFSEMTQERLQKTHRFLMIIGLSVIIIIAIGCIMYSFIFSNSLVRPLENLLTAIEKVKDGNLKVRSQVNSDDEIGELSLDFNEMIEKIDNSQNDLNLEKDNLKKSKIELEKKINELERFQKLTIDREIKMIELKKQIKKLEEGLDKKDAKK